MQSCSGYEYAMPKKLITRRELFKNVGHAALLSAFVTPGKGFAITAHAEPLNVVAGADRVVMRTGKTYLNAWVGYGEPPRAVRGGRGPAATAQPTPGPSATTLWSKV